MKRITTTETGLKLSTDADIPTPLPHQSLIKVTAISLNRGEISMATGDAPGSSIGWDYVGVVEQPAADGKGHPIGTRVAGWRPEQDAFAEYVIGDPAYMAPIPDGVTDAQAATLPVAGLTALAAVERGSRLIGHNVLVNGVTGGVGFFALQLAKLSGANAVAYVRSPEQAEFAKSAGADAAIVVGDDQGLSEVGPFRLVVDGVAGEQLGTLLKHTAEGGTVVNYGATSGDDSVVTPWPDLFGNGARRSLYGLSLYTEGKEAPYSDGLARLLRLVADGQLSLPETTVAEGPRLRPTPVNSSNVRLAARLS